MAKRKYPYHYILHNLKHVNTFLDPETYEKLKRIAEEADKSVSRYARRVLEAHIKQVWSERKDLPSDDGHNKN